MSPALYDGRACSASKSFELELEGLAHDHVEHEVNLFLLYSGLGKPQSVAAPLAAGAKEGLPELPGHGDAVQLPEPGHDGSVWGQVNFHLGHMVANHIPWAPILQNILQHLICKQEPKEQYMYNMLYIVYYRLYYTYTLCYIVLLYYICCSILLWLRAEGQTPLASDRAKFFMTAPTRGAGGGASPGQFPKAKPRILDAHVSLACMAV